MPWIGTPALALAALFITAVASPARAEPVLFVLGDSLSDVGNAAGAADYLLGAVADMAPVGFCNLADVFAERPCDDVFYRRSRVSDGPVAVEHLAAQLGLPELAPSLHIVPGRATTATVYAVAGAKARAHDDADLARQLDWLLLDHAPFAEDALFIVMIGGNDAIDALQADAEAPNAEPLPSADIVAAAVAAIGATVERLLDFGARRVVVANVPDLATLPGVRAAVAGRPDADALLARASAISAELDAGLQATLDAVEESRRLYLGEGAIVRFDLRAELVRIRQAAASDGRNADDACFDSVAYRESRSAERAFHPDCAPLATGEPPRFSRFLFWDGIHPTGATHAQLGTALFDLLHAAPTNE